PGPAEGAGASGDIGGAAQVGPVAVALQAIDELAVLPVIAKLAAEQAAFDVETRRQAVPLRSAEAVAAVGADVETRPAERHIRGRRRLGDRRRRSARQIRSRPGSDHRSAGDASESKRSSR